jgi:peptidoglycan/xylan/chitin deacetylase (PgdA/CDA1 family)
MTHSILSALSPADLVSELAESKARIESELGHSCPWLAYPNGGASDFSPEVVAAAEAAGYTVAFTLMGRTNSQAIDPLAIDRICIPGELSKDEFDAGVHGFRSLLAR